MAEPWTALVTGASRGIGAAVVDAFVRAGARVAAAAPASEQPADRQMDEAVFDLAMDVRDPVSVAAAVASAEKRLGRIDVLVNGAGIIERTPFFRLSEEQWRDVIETNLGGTFRVPSYPIPRSSPRKAGWPPSFDSHAERRATSPPLPPLAKGGRNASGDGF